MMVIYGCYDLYRNTGYQVERVDDIVEKIQNITYKDVKAYLYNLWNELCIQVNFIGNFEEKKCNE